MSANFSFTRPEGAFTRVELLAIVMVLTLISLVVVPALANTKARGDRVICANNLRLIGRAVDMWIEDPRSMPPWWTAVSEGGTRFHQNHSDAWFNYAVMSNELKTASILACPSDPQARVAVDFSNSGSGGLFHAAFRNNAISYFLELDSFVFGRAGPGPIPSTSSPTGWVGDRNLQVDATGVGCSSGVRNVAAITYPSRAQWTNSIHGAVGNVLLTDGRVEQLLNSNLVPTIHPYIADDIPIPLHLLMPR